MISNMIMKMWLCLDDVATMVKPRQKAVTYCRTREPLLFYGEPLGIKGQKRVLCRPISCFIPPVDSQPSSVERPPHAARASRHASLTDYQRFHRLLWQVHGCQMDEIIVVSGKTYPIRDGHVINVPAGSGGKRTTFRMLVENGLTVEAVSAFQAHYYRTALRRVTHTRA